MFAYVGQGAGPPRFPDWVIIPALSSPDGLREKTGHAALRDLDSARTKRSEPPLLRQYKVSLAYSECESALE